MERKRQQACVGIGAALLMAAGIGLVILFYYGSSSLAVQTFDTRIITWPLWAGVALFILGVLGAILAGCWSRGCLCFYAWLAVALGTALLCTGSILLTQPPSFSTKVELLCEEADSPAALAGLGAPVSVRAAQDSFDSMLEALARCRKQNSLAIRLDACPDAVDSAKKPWGVNPHRQLFRWAENAFSCGGFCKGAPPLFGLPRGSVNEANRAQIRHACFAPIAADIRLWSLLAAGALLSAAVLLLAPAYCACWLACAPPPVRRHGHVHHKDELEWTAVPQEDWDSDDAED